MTVTSSPTPVAIPKLPNWTNAQSVVAFLVIVAGYVMSYLVALVPSWTGSAAIQAAIPSVGTLVAAGATVFLVVTHRSTMSRILAHGGTAPLPTWTDPASVSAYINTIAGATFAVLTLIPGWHEPVVVHIILPLVGFAVAAVVSAVNVSSHAKVHATAITAKLVVAPAVSPVVTPVPAGA